MKPFIVLALCLLPTGAVLAQTVSELTTTRPSGETFTTTTETTRNGNTRMTTWTGVGSDGRGYERTATQVWDPKTRSWRRTVSGETASGRTWSHDGGGSCANGRCDASSTFVGPRGEISTRTWQRTRQDGVVRQRTEWTSRNGTTVRTWRRVR